jgi:hypothetical protein
MRRSPLSRFATVATPGLLTLFVVAAVFACGSATSSSTGADAATGRTSCDELASAARQEVASAIDAHRTCSSGADCVATSLSASCFDSCGRAVRAGSQADVDAAKARVNAAQCKQFIDQGCKIVVPPCAPPTAPSCDNERCN